MTPLIAAAIGFLIGLVTTILVALAALWIVIKTPDDHGGSD